MEVKKIILDTDIGDDIDDAFALALILNSPEIELLGVTTVFKNTDLRAKLVKRELQLFGRDDIEVYAGCDIPLAQDIITWPFETKMPDGKIKIRHYLDEMKDIKYGNIHAVDYLLNMLKKHPHEITLLAIGPLTNLANAYLKDKESFSLAKDIVLMGGQLEGTFPEWNIVCDPEAARIVFTSGVPIKAIGVNVTKECKLTKELLAYLDLLKQDGNKLLVQMLKIWRSDNPEKTPIMHDPLAVSSLIDEFCEFDDYYIKVETEGKNRAYTLTVDKNAPYSNLITMAKSVDVDSFLTFFQSRIKD